MSPAESQEHYVQTQVNEAFHYAFGRSLDGRIKMAAFAVGEQVGILRALIEKQARKALKLAETSFHLFNVADPNQQ